MISVTLTVGDIRISLLIWLMPKYSCCVWFEYFIPILALNSAKDYYSANNKYN